MEFLISEYENHFRKREAIILSKIFLSQILYRFLYFCTSFCRLFESSESQSKSCISSRKYIYREIISDAIIRWDFPRCCKVWIWFKIWDLLVSQSYISISYSPIFCRIKSFGKSFFWSFQIISFFHLPRERYERIHISHMSDSLYEDSLSKFSGSIKFFFFKYANTLILDGTYRLI